MMLYQLLPLTFTPLSACNLNLPAPAPFFHLEAVFLDNPSERVPITMTSIVERQVLANTGFGLVTKTEAGILSVRPFDSSLLTFADLCRVRHVRHALSQFPST